jgi:hypothetical protein
MRHIWKRKRGASYFDHRGPSRPSKENTKPADDFRRIVGVRCPDVVPTEAPMRLKVVSCSYREREGVSAFYMS